MYEHYFDVLLQHSELFTPQEFFDVLKTSMNDSTPAHTFPSLSNEAGYTVEPTAAGLNFLLNSFFVQRWDTYLQAKAEEARLLLLKEFIDTTLKESATVPVAMALNEITMESPQLAAFVSDQVKKFTDKLRGQVSQLQKQLSQT